MRPLVVTDLVDATLLFLDRHEEALGSGMPARALEACDGLHQGICATLAAQVGQAHNALAPRRDGAADPSNASAFADALSRGVADDPLAREAWAFASLRKRVAESEGALLHLRLTLARGSADGPALPAYYHRVHAETHGVLRVLTGLRAALLLWADAADVAQGGASAGRAKARAALPRELTRAARECLVAGAPDAAAPLLARALEAVSAMDSPLDKAALARVRAALDEAPPRDLVVAWRLLDFVEHACAVAGMPPRALS